MVPGAGDDGRSVPASDGVGAVVFDVDGTLLRGREPLPGACEAVAAVRDAGMPVLFVSNNPVDPPVAYARRLRDAGLSATPDEVVTSGVVTADYLAREHPAADTFVVGEAGLVAMLEERNVAAVEDPRRAEVVLASIDRSFDYDRLATALLAFDAGDPVFLGTDPDRTIPGEDGPLPGSGAIVEAVASVAGRPPDRVLGKPDRATREAVLGRLDVAPGRCLVVGDRVDTDVALGARAGMETALVLSGVTGRADLDRANPDRSEEGAPDHPQETVPDHVLDSVAAVPDLVLR